MRLRALVAAALGLVATTVAFTLPALASEGGGVDAVEEPSTSVPGGTGADVTLQAPPAVMVGRTAVLRGTAPTPGSVAQLQSGSGAGAWSALASGVVASDGRFEVSWRPRRIGRLKVRVVLGLDGPGEAADAATSPETEVNVVRSALATIFGPGFYGQLTACNVRLTPQTLGVAHRKLPCGTPVLLYYKGETAIVPVMDRGPYTAASWDLTEATAELLGFDSTGRVGALALRSPRG